MITIAGKQFPADRMIWIRTKTGQVLEVIPNVAATMVNGGTADLFEGAAQVPGKGSLGNNKVETTALDPARERAVAPPQKAPKRKPKA